MEELNPVQRKRDGRSSALKSVKRLVKHMNNLREIVYAIEEDLSSTASSRNQGVGTNEEDDEPKDALLADVPLEFVVPEEEIRNLCGDDQIYRRGVQYFAQNRVVERLAVPHPAGLDLIARVKGKSRPYYNLAIRFEMDRRHMLSRCECPVARRSMCKHVVATLLCWYRQPESFSLDLGRLSEDDVDDPIIGSKRDSRLIDPKFAEGVQKTISLLEKTLRKIETSTKSEDFKILEGVNGITRQAGTEFRNCSRESVEYGKLVSITSASIIGAIDGKYRIGLVSTYNRMIAGSIMGHVIERFIEGIQNFRSEAQEKEQRLDAGKVGLKGKGKGKAGEGRGNESELSMEEVNASKLSAMKGKSRNGAVSRSWDSIVENFMPDGKKQRKEKK